ncbi:VOC family protein [Dietzia cinnamea]|uniref:VOC family protein n=1 Tax=Dietzia cinnamea TaxID=321318 RepID=A0ABV3YGL1_9ACTN|nr:MULTISPECIES: VOC family protein [Dietzia]KZO58161.1 bleomycin resistance protein [Dietzia maris]AVM63266.1 glyoxalase/bleomycin resistance/extradiol dioxygenase family protein [Dietzia sp. oral taxon 368]MCT1640054.1 VOC family protein [Dietzia cinnamea]MCT2059399.1 VOC family protein [Dietzia cinnamea]MCT2099729.1 VOC family protein [Dietzia cinnamea]
MPRIAITSVHVDDQSRALTFYTEVLGFVHKHDFPAGDFRWLTVVDPGDPNGTQLLLEPDQHPAARAYATALHADGIPAAQFEVDDIHRAHAELQERGARIVQPPTEAGPVWTMILDDTCGNLVQLVTAADV